MPYYNLTVSVGDYTQASHYNKATGDTEWVRALVGVDHNMDTSTGTGYHLAEEGEGNSPLHLVASDGYVYAAALYKPAGGGLYLILQNLGEDGTGSCVRASAEAAIPIYGIGELAVPES